MTRFKSYDLSLRLSLSSLSHKLFFLFKKYKAGISQHILYYKHIIKLNCFDVFIRCKKNEFRAGHDPLISTKNSYFDSWLSLEVAALRLLNRRLDTIVQLELEPLDKLVDVASLELRLVLGRDVGIVGGVVVKLVEES